MAPSMLSQQCNNLQLISHTLVQIGGHLCSVPNTVQTTALLTTALLTTALLTTALLTPALLTCYMSSVLNLLLIQVECIYSLPPISMQSQLDILPICCAGHTVLPINQFQGSVQGHLHPHQELRHLYERTAPVLRPNWCIARGAG